MRRFRITVVLVGASALGMTLGLAGTASAAPNDNAVCVAQNISAAHAALGGKAFAHAIVVPDAHDGGAGDTIASFASTNCGTR